MAIILQQDVWHSEYLEKKNKVCVILSFYVKNSVVHLSDLIQEYYVSTSM